MAQAIRRNNIAVLQARRKKKWVGKFFTAALGLVVAMVSIIGFIAAPYFVEAIVSPEITTTLLNP